MTQRPLTTVPSWVEFVCPFCKGDLERGLSDARCLSCDALFGRTDGTWDFRRQYPEGVISPPGWQHWLAEQVEYENWANSPAGAIDIAADEPHVRTLEPIYATLVPLSGRILDVAGGYGMLRHFLKDTDQYLSIDPWLEAPARLAPFEDQIRSFYPRVVTPVPFVSGNAEWLPFRARSFDWVHMRSCLDHLLDPFQALREAWRVLVPGGRLAIGISASGGPSAVLEPGFRGFAARIAAKVRAAGLRATVGRALERLKTLERDHHLWHPSQSNVIHLVRAAGFEMQEWRWQGAPAEHCLYLRAIK